VRGVRISKIPLNFLFFFFFENNCNDLCIDHELTKFVKISTLESLIFYFILFIKKYGNFGNFGMI
jgi:hypothetical protein